LVLIAFAAKPMAPKTTHMRTKTDRLKERRDEDEMDHRSATGVDADSRVDADFDQVWKDIVKDDDQSRSAVKARARQQVEGERRQAARAKAAGRGASDRADGTSHDGKGSPTQTAATGGKGNGGDRDADKYDIGSHAGSDNNRRPKREGKGNSGGGRKDPPDDEWPWDENGDDDDEGEEEEDAEGGGDDWWDPPQRRGYAFGKGAGKGYHSNRPPREEHVRWRSGAPPPAPFFNADLAKDPKCYMTWMKKVRGWEFLIAKYMPRDEHAVHLFTAISGDAAGELESYEAADFAHDQGVADLTAIMDVFDDEYVLEKSTAIEQFERVKRAPGEGLRAYVRRFERTERMMCSFGIRKYDAEIKAHKFMNSAFLSQQVRNSILISTGHLYEMGRIKLAINVLFPAGRDKVDRPDSDNKGKKGGAKGGSKGKAPTALNFPAEADAAEDEVEAAEGEELDSAQVDEREAADAARKDEEVGEYDIQETLVAAAETLSMAGEALSVTAQKLKSKTLGRGFTTQKPGFPQKKNASSPPPSGNADGGKAKSSGKGDGGKGDGTG
jgi:hypothetical protein